MFPVYHIEREIPLDLLLCIKFLNFIFYIVHYCSLQQTLNGRIYKKGLIMRYLLSN